MKATKRFTSEKSAQGFAKRVGGDFSDLRGHHERKSDFKVTYTKGTTSNSDRETDFDSDLNMNGTRWHTAEDL